MDNTLLEELQQKYLLGIANDVEIQQLMDWYYSFDDEMVNVKTANIHEEKEVYDRLRLKIEDIIHRNPRKKDKVFDIRRNGYWQVAVVFIVLFSGYWFLKNHTPENKNQLQTRTASDIQPGQEGAILTLANGKKIFLDSAQNGNIAIQGTGIVIKNGTQVIYTPGNSEKNTPLAYNTIVTPKGRDFEVVLPDSSKVWLNAASSIRFPTVFNDKPRVVEITGEAYFEVSHQLDKKGNRVPFVVHTNKMTIQVLGTHFNVNAYDDEQYTRTTLLEGSVAASKIGSNELVKIIPGQQAFISNLGPGNVSVKQADVNKAIAWKNGLFQFDDDQLQAILRQVSRWYNVDIDCAEQKKNLRFNGIISKRSNVKAILDLLSATGVVNFKMENGKLIAY